MNTCQNCGLQLQYDQRTDGWSCPNCAQAPQVAQGRHSAARPPLGPIQQKHIPWISFGIAFAIALIIPTWAMLGIIVSLVVAYVLWKKFNPGRPVIPPKGQRSAFYPNIMQLAGRMLVTLVLIAPIASGGLNLPSFHNPNTFMKYLSVVFVIPSNLGMSAPIAVFPGIPALVVPSLFVLIAGLHVPTKFLSEKRKLLVQIIGMLLITLAPAISYAVMSNPFWVGYGYGPIFYLGWLGIFLQLKPDMIAGKLFKSEYQGYQPAMYSMAMLGAVLVPFIYGLVSAPAILAQETLGDAIAFEAAHHTLAGVFSGLLGGAISAELTILLVGPYPFGPKGPRPTAPAPPQQASQPATWGSKHGETITIKDHRGVDMDVTYDANTGEWMTDHGTSVDLSRVEQARREHQADREWSAGEHQRVATRDTDIDRELRRIKSEADAEQKAILNRRKKRVMRRMNEARREEADMWRAEGDREEKWENRAAAVEKTADVTIDILAGVTGPAGKTVKRGYGIIKNVTGGMSEGHHDGTGMWKGAKKGAGKAAVDVAFDAAKGKLGKMTNGKIPGLPAKGPKSLKELAKIKPGNLTELDMKNRLINQTIISSVTGAGQSQAESKVITDPIKVKLGLKKP